MAGYVYGGTEFDAHLPIPRKTQQTRTGVRDVVECGTNSGHNAHMRKKEPPCNLCRRAHNDYAREYKRRRRAEKKAAE